MKLKSLFIGCCALLAITYSFSDNQQLFNDAYQTGKNNQAKMNLNANSTINSYATSNKLESTFTNNANSGTSGSKDLYNGGTSNKKYLYDKGVQSLADCKNQADPRCSTLNKYTDKDTQNELQAYSHNVSEQYYIHTRPDPSSSSCTYVSRKKPINSSTHECIAAPHDQLYCHIKAMVTINTNSYQCNPNNGGCDKYKSNQLCTLIRDYKPQSCTEWNYDAPGTHLKNRICKTNRNTGHCVAGQQVGYRIDCKHGFDSGLCGVDKNINWTCTNYQPEELAVYSCKEPQYNKEDECAASANRCRLINSECTDSAPTKVIGGLTIKLSDVCSTLGLSGEKCCWDTVNKRYCGDATDTCDIYRKNPNCVIQNNECIDKDYITGGCNKFKSTYTCSNGFERVEDKICTDVVCSNNESGTAKKCFNTPLPTKDNESNMGSAVAYLGMAQNMAQELNCTDKSHPTADTCTLFSGKYNTCYMYVVKEGQPSSYWNNGADCSIRMQYFNSAGAPVGNDASDRNLYSKATSNSNNIMGGFLSYSMSNDNSTAINNSIALKTANHSQVANPDENTGYNENYSKNSSIHVGSSGQITTTINKDKVKDISAVTTFDAYLEDGSVNLAWNRIKAEKDPNNVISRKLSTLGITRRAPANAFRWTSGTNEPVINGLCIHLADYCDGGDDAATNSRAVKSQLAEFNTGNRNFCAKCDVKSFGSCVWGSPKPVRQQWCCFNSKVALDITLAAYDQGIIDLYNTPDSKSNNRFFEWVKLKGSNGCGGITVSDISEIDFSKADYFRDLMDSFDMNKVLDMNNFTNGNVMNNTQNRSQTDAGKYVDEWKKKYGS